MNNNTLGKLKKKRQDLIDKKSAMDLLYMRLTMRGVRRVDLAVLSREIKSFERFIEDMNITIMWCQKQREIPVLLDHADKVMEVAKEADNKENNIGITKY